MVRFGAMQLLAGTPNLEAQSVEFLDQHENRATGRDRCLAVRFPQRPSPPSQLLDLRLVQTHGSEYPIGRVEHAAIDSLPMTTA